MAKEESCSPSISFNKDIISSSLNNAKRFSISINLSILLSHAFGWVKSNESGLSHWIYIEEDISALTKYESSISLIISSLTSITLA